MNRLEALWKKYSKEGILLLTGKEEELRNEDLRQVYKRVIRMFVGFGLSFLLVGGIVIFVGWATESTQIVHSGWGFVVLGFCVFLLALIVWVVWEFHGQMIVDKHVTAQPYLRRQVF